MNLYTETITQFEFVGNNKMVKSDCFSIAFKVPSGGNSVNINGSIIPAGESLSISQLPGMIDRTQYEVLFISGTGTNNLEVSRTVPKNQPSQIGV